MQTRENALNKWLKNILGDLPFTLVPLAGDASFRRYFRVLSREFNRIVMDAPPDKEPVTSFINIGNKLKEMGVHTPTIHASDEAQGFVLLEDMGDSLLLQVVTCHNAEKLYKAAMHTLIHIQQCPTTDPFLPTFDKAFMLKEMALFQEWFLQSYLNLELSRAEITLLDETCDWLAAEIAVQPQVFIHRDYHSRNLLIIDQNDPYDVGVLDFQDAMRGPFTYDLVSLLKDCYIQWPRDQIIQWVTDFYHNSVPHSETLSEFIRAFDLCGLQRHLKVLGIFCRLYLRDNKPGYLRDLPLTFQYAMTCLETYRELQPLHDFMQQRVYLPFSTKSLS